MPWVGPQNKTKQKNPPNLWYFILAALGHSYSSRTGSFFLSGEKGVYKKKKERKKKIAKEGREWQNE